MGLRIVLVGLVAGLGLSIPSRDQICGLGGNARAWMSAQLVEWDGQMPAGETAFVVVPEPTPTADPVPAPAAEIVVSAPEPAATAPATAADELPAGLETPTEPADLAEADPAPAAIEPTAVPALEISDSAFDAAQSEVIAGFLADQAAAIVVVEAARAEPVAAFEPYELCDESESELADILNREADGLDLTMPLLAVRENDPIEALDLEENLYEGIAYDLNRESEGLEPAAPAVAAQRPAAVASDNETGRLTHAVRLTREAVYAWANLLHGPAVVTIDH